MPKIIEIGKYLFKLQLKMSGVFFETHCRYTELPDGEHRTPLLCVSSFWHTTGVCRTYRQTDWRTDGFAVAYTALTLRRVVKMRISNTTLCFVFQIRTQREVLCIWSLSTFGARNFHFRGYSAGGLSRGKPRYRGSGTRNWSSLRTLLTDFDSRNDQTLRISHSSPPDFRPVCFTVRE